MKNRCVGCGSILQNTNKNEKGYTPKENSKYCMRCFQLKNYGILSNYDVNKDNATIIEIVNKQQQLVFFMIDILNLNAEVIETYKKIKTKKVIVVSKSDIIPEEIKIEKIINLLKRYNINDEIIMLSSKLHIYTKSLLKYMDKYNTKKSYLMGYTNVGKSSLINELTKNNNITTSNMLNTTLDFINIKIDDYIITDTPGFNYKSTWYDNALVNLINPKKKIKSRNYQTKENQVFTILDKISVTGFGVNRVIFYLSNDIIIKKEYKLDLNKKYIDINIPSNSDLVIKGLGFVNIKDKCILKINQDMEKYIEIRKSIMVSSNENSSNEWGFSQ